MLEAIQDSYFMKKMNFSGRVGGRKTEDKYILKVSVLRTELNDKVGDKHLAGILK